MLFWNSPTDIKAMITLFKGLNAKSRTLKLSHYINLTSLSNAYC
jgi:hypothetical protein